MNPVMFESATGTDRVIRKVSAFHHVAWIGLYACMISSVHAMNQGHARLVSSPGSPLDIVVPVTSMSAEDQKSLKVEVALASLWKQSGLTPPVPLDTLRVEVKPGSRPDSRTIIVQSAQVSKQSVVDVLLTLSAASGTRQFQVSLLQPAFAQAALPSSTASIRVQSGDTLYGIAQRHLVPGATIHQMLWALFEANPGAFISDNMNLLRAGSVLNIPDATTVLAIDPAMARSRFAEHDARFRSMRGKRSAVTGQTPVIGSASESSGTLSHQQKLASPAQSAENRLLLSSSEKDRQSDLQASQKREIAENQARVGELQQNIQQMKNALGQRPGSVSDARTDGPTTSIPNVMSGAGQATQSGSKASSPATGAKVTETGDTTSDSLSSKASPGLPSHAGAPSVSAATSMSGNTGVAATANVGSAASTQPTGAQNVAESAQKDSSVSTQWLKDNFSIAITALLALVAFLIGMRMRRHSTRRDDESDDADAGEQVSPAAKTAFEKKLQTIDLNLDQSGTPAQDTKNSTSS